jgi:hypothetical protein
MNERIPSYPPVSSLSISSQLSLSASLVPWYGKELIEAAFGIPFRLNLLQARQVRLAAIYSLQGLVAVCKVDVPVDQESRGLVC